MPRLHIPPDLDLHYRIDDFTDPWRKAQTHFDAARQRGEWIGVVRLGAEARTAVSGCAAGHARVR